MDNGWHSYTMTAKNTIRKGFMTNEMHYVNPQTGEGKCEPSRIAPNAEAVLASIKASIQSKQEGTNNG